MATASSSNLLYRIDTPDTHTTSEILLEAKHKLSNFLFAYKKSNGQPEVTFQVQEWLKYVDKFLLWLESAAVMTPAVRDSSGIRPLLEALFDPKYHCPSTIASRARTIYERFEADHWGAAGDEGENIDTTVSITPGITSRPPPLGHPIWGQHGIMHGFLLKSTTSRIVMNPAYTHAKRGCKEFGHNGLEPGAWWPYQAVALFHGAHGASEAGISGHPDRGTYSIVLSGHYAEMNEDNGETLWYSSDGSKDNTDPNRILSVSGRSASLHTSFRTHRPIRVLRSSKGSPTYSPREGIRYDGLYCVTQVKTARNDKGGLYEKFKLSRQPNQASLGSIRDKPTQQQLSDYYRIKEYY
jgi:hypothetical protein